MINYIIYSIKYLYNYLFGIKSPRVFKDDIFSKMSTTAK